MNLELWRQEKSLLNLREEFGFKKLFFIKVASEPINLVDCREINNLTELYYKFQSEPPTIRPGGFFSFFGRRIAETTNLGSRSKDGYQRIVFCRRNRKILQRKMLNSHQVETSNQLVYLGGKNTLAVQNQNLSQSNMISTQDLATGSFVDKAIHKGHIFASNSLIIPKDVLNHNCRYSRKKFLEQVAGIRKTSYRLIFSKKNIRVLLPVFTNSSGGRIFLVIEEGSRDIILANLEVGKFKTFKKALSSEVVDDANRIRVKVYLERSFFSIVFWKSPGYFKQANPMLMLGKFRLRSTDIHELN